MRTLSMIVAHDRNRAIGFNGQLPWHLPDDLRRFKALTLGHSVLMGRKTFESIGRPLPGRRNLVLSRDPGFKPANVETYDNLDDVLNAASRDSAIWVIGGGVIYALALPHVHQLEVTEVDTQIAQADTWFPALRASDFEQISRVRHEADSAHAHAFDFVSLRATHS